MIAGILGQAAAAGGPNLVGWTVFAVLAAGLLVFLYVRFDFEARGRKDLPLSYPDILITWAGVGFLWWLVASNFDTGKLAMLTGSGLTGLSVGAVAGFLFTTYGEEAASVGKVRDWLLGALTGVTLVEVASGAGQIRGVVAVFAGTSSGPDFAFHSANLIGSSTLGFFALFVSREIYLNPALAEARRQRKQLEDALNKEGRAVAEAAAGTQPKARIPGALELEETRKLEPQIREKAEALVRKAEQAGVNPRDFDADSALRLAHSFSAAENYSEAIRFFERVLQLDPVRGQATLGLARAYSAMGAPAKAAEAIETRKESLRDDYAGWLGYYLLWLPDRLMDAVRYNKEYLEKYPRNEDAQFNLACAHAQLYGQTGEKPHRDASIVLLKHLLGLHPSWRSLAQELASSSDKDFYSLRNDPEFKTLIRTAERSAPSEHDDETEEEEQ